MSIYELNEKQQKYLELQGFNRVSPFRASKDTAKYYIINLAHERSFGKLEFTISINGRESYSLAELDELQRDLLGAKHFINNISTHLEDLK